MTNEEIMVADAEYWAGTVSGGDLVKMIPEVAHSRIAYLEREYGRFLDNEDRTIDAGEVGLTKCEHRSWFSLLIAAAEAPDFEFEYPYEGPKVTAEQVAANWPFPVIHGSIPA